MSDEVIIRDAIVDDSQAIFHLNLVSLGYEYPVNKTAEQLAKLMQSGNDKILVAEVNGKVVGYLHLNSYDLLYAEHIKNIMGIAVDPEYRRAGIGSMLLRTGESGARKTGASAVRLVSGENRSDAHAFYRSIGYEGNKMQLNLKKAL